MVLVLSFLIGAALGAVAGAATSGRRRPTDWLAASLTRVADVRAAFVFHAAVDEDRGLEVLGRGPGRDRLLGGPSAGAPVVDFAHAVHPDDRSAHRAAESWAVLSRGEEVEVEFRLVGIDGVTRWMSERLVPYWESGRLLVDAITVDVSEQRAFAAAVEETRRHLESVIRAARTHVYVALTDAAGGWHEIYIGPGDDDLLGCSWEPDEDRVAAWEQAVHPDDRERYAEAMARTQGGVGFDIEYRLVGRDGVTRTVWEQALASPVAGAGFRINGFVQDVTERRSAERELERTRRHLEQVLAASRAHVYVGEVSSGTFVEVFAGPGDDVLLGRTFGAGDDRRAAWDEAIEPADRDAVADARRRAVEGLASEVRYRLHGADGVTRWVVDRTFPRSEDGRSYADGIVYDATAQVAAELAAVESRAQVDRVLDSIDDVLFTIDLSVGDPRVAVTTIGPGLARLLGEEGADLRRLLDLVIEEHHGTFVDHLAQLRATGQAECEVQLRRRDGNGRWLWLRSRVRHGGADVADGVLSDVTARRLAALELEHASRVDPLTGIFNRRHFTAVAESLLAQAACGATATAVVLLDLDRFKLVNDTYGHAAGDAVLVECARRMRTALRHGDTLARWGGEEFIVLLPECDEAGAAVVAEQIRAAIAATPVPGSGGDLIEQTASLGVAATSGAELEIGVLSALADRALYVAKRSGRDQVRRVSALQAVEPGAEEPEMIRVAEALARWASVREGVSDLHCAQVADLSAKVARRIGLSPAMVVRTRLGGWLHDVGKIAVPDRVLGKRGPLTAEERSVIESHAEVGMALVSRTPGISDAAPAVGHHHEWFDGTGYPDGLAGEAIPVEARIISAVDTWTAMTEDRLYRSGLEWEGAVAELRHAAGTQLDPTIVGALIDVLEDERLQVMPRLSDVA